MLIESLLSDAIQMRFITYSNKKSKYSYLLGYVACDGVWGIGKLKVFSILVMVVMMQVVYLNNFLIEVI
jgi:hypothetical protein